MENNALHISIWMGIVSEDKLYNQRLTKVFINTLLPFFKGELKNFASEEVINILNDNSDSNEQITVKTSNTITADYFELCSNRTIPPDVRKGEQVIIFQLEDSDIYYWLPTGRDDNLRRLETLRYHVSASQDVQKVLNDINTYFIEMDTLRKKAITIQTSQADKEEFGYTIKIDAKANKIHIKDNDGNEFEIDSNEPKITLINKNNAFVIIKQDDIFIQNNDTSYVTLVKNVITAHNVDDSKIQIDKNNLIASNADGSSVKIAGSNISVIAPGNIDITASGNIDVVGSTIKASGSAIVAESSAIAINGGSVAISGAVSINSTGVMSMESSGSMIINSTGAVALNCSDLTLGGGTVTLNGNVVISGNLSLASLPNICPMG